MAATYIDHLISYWCGQIISCIYIYIYSVYVEDVISILPRECSVQWCGAFNRHFEDIFIYIYITDEFTEHMHIEICILIANGCWENGLWYFTWIIVTPDAYQFVPTPYINGLVHEGRNSNGCCRCRRGVTCWVGSDEAPYQRPWQSPRQLCPLALCSPTGRSWLVWIQLAGWPWTFRNGSCAGGG